MHDYLHTQRPTTHSRAGLFFVAILSLIFSLSPLHAQGTTEQQPEPSQETPVTEKELPDVDVSALSYLLPYSVKLVDPSGNALVGTVNVVFSLYDSEQSQTPLWQEAFTGDTAIGLAGGHLSVLLGKQKKLKPELFQSRHVFVGLKINDDEELRPLTRLNRVPFVGYALDVKKTDLLNGLAPSRYLTKERSLPELEIRTLTVPTLTVRTSLTVQEAKVSTFNSQYFVGDGSKLNNLSADTIGLGSLPFNRGGLNSTSVSDVLNQLEINLSTLLLGTLISDGHITTNALSVLYNEKQQKPVSHAFENKLTVDMLADNAIDFKNSLAFERYVRKSGDKVSKDIIITPTKNVALSNSTGSLILANNGDVSADKLVIKNSLIVGNIVREIPTDSVKGSDAGKQAINYLSLENQVGDNLFINEDHLKDFKQNDLGLRQFAGIETLTADSLGLENEDRRNYINQLLGVNATAYLDIVEPGYFGSANLREAFEVQAIAEKDTLRFEDFDHTHSFNMPSGSLRTVNTYKDTLAVDDQTEPLLPMVSTKEVDLDALTKALNLGQMAYRNMITSQDITSDELGNALKLGRLAKHSTMDHRMMSDKVMTEHLKLGSLAFESILPTANLDIQEIANSTKLGELAKLNTIDASQFEDIERFATETIGLKTLARLHKLALENIDSDAIADGLQLKDLSRLETITSTNIGSITDFRESITTKNLATTSVITFADLNVATLNQALGLKALATVSTINPKTHIDLSNFSVNTSNLASRYATELTRLNATQLTLYDPETGLKRPLNNEGTLILEDAKLELIKTHKVIAKTIHSNDRLTLKQIEYLDDTHGLKLNQHYLNDQGLSVRNSKLPVSGWIQPSGYYFQVGKNNRQVGAFGGYSFIGETNNQIMMGGIETQDHRPLLSLKSLGTHSTSDKGTALVMTTLNGGKIRAEVQNMKLLIKDKVASMIANDLTAEINTKDAARLLSNTSYIGLTSTGNLDASAKVIEQLQKALIDRGAMPRAGHTVTGFWTLNKAALHVGDHIKLSQPSLTAKTLTAKTVSVTGTTSIVTGDKVRKLNQLAIKDKVFFPEHFETPDALKTLFPLDDKYTHQQGPYGGTLAIEQTATQSGSISIRGFESGENAKILPSGYWVKQVYVDSDQGYQELTLSGDRNYAEITANVLTVKNAVTIPKYHNTKANLRIMPKADVRASSNIFVGPSSISSSMLGYDDTSTIVAISNKLNDDMSSAALYSDRKHTGLSFHQHGQKKANIQLDTTGAFSLSTEEQLRIRHNRSKESLANSITLTPTDLTLSGNIHINPVTGKSLDQSILSFGDTTARLNGDITLPTNFTTDYSIKSSFRGDGLSITHLNASNFAKGSLPIEHGGRGEYSMDEYVALISDLENGMTSTEITVNGTAKVDTFYSANRRFKSTSGLSMTIQVASNVSFSERVTSNKATTFEQSVSLEDSNYSSFGADIDKNTFFNDDVMMMSAGEESDSSVTPSLHIQNLANATLNEGGAYVQDQTDGSAVGGVAISAHSFGNAPTLKSIHHSTKGAAFHAVVHSDAETMEQIEFAAVEGAINAINQNDGHGIVAESNGELATLLANNNGHGEALLAQNHGFQPAIKATSLGETAIFALGNIHTSSSKRWKTDISVLEDALDNLLNVNGVHYLRTDKIDTKRRIGFIAEEIGAIYPELVDYDSNGVDAIAVAYGKVNAILVEGIKAQDEHVHALSMRTDQLGNDQQQTLDRLKALKVRLTDMQH